MGDTAAPPISRAPAARSRLLKIAVGVLGYAAIAALAVRTIDRERFWEGLDRLRLAHVAAILAVSLAHIAGRALRYHALLVREEPRAYRVRDGVGIFLAGLCLSAVTPGRAGDLVKAKLVGRHGVTGGAGLGLVLIERTLDLLVVTTSVVVTGALLSGRAAAGAWRGVSAALIAALIAGVALMTARRARAPLLGAISRIIGRLSSANAGARARQAFAGLFAAWDRTFSAPKRLAAFALFSAAIWTIEFSKLHLVLSLMGLHAEPAVVFFVYPLSLIAGILTVLPFSEGMVGLTGVALLVSLTAIDPGSATVAVVVDRAASVLPPLCLWGAWSLFGGLRKAG
jgi:uncharacterized protein (TIRG00374 family)